MATTVIQDGQPGSRARFHDSFLLHKLHSLSGIFPIGGFMAFHLIANSYSLRGEVEFNTVVKTIGYTPFVLLVEIGVIFIPILFHAIYGLMITAEMQGPGGNVAHYAYGRNWLYMAQRVTGVIALLYICYHVTTTTGTRWMYELTGGADGHEQGYRAIAYEAMALRFTSIPYLLVYVIGVASAAFHLGNGLFNFCIRWGIAIGKEAQKIVAGIGWLVGLGLAFVGLWTAVNFHFKGLNYEVAPGQYINLAEKYSSVDELVKSGAQAPAEPVPGAKPAEPGTDNAAVPGAAATPVAAPEATPAASATTPATPAAQPK